MVRLYLVQETMTCRTTMTIHANRRGLITADAQRVRAPPALGPLSSHGDGEVWVMEMTRPRMIARRAHARAPISRMTDDIGYQM